MKRKIFTGSSVIMLVCMVIAIGAINACAKTEKEDGSKNFLADRPWMVAFLSGVAVWFIDYLFDTKGRDKIADFAQNHSESILA